MPRSISAAIALASLLLATMAPTASAECMNWPIGADERLGLGYAFAATVTEASRDVDPAVPDNAPFDWHVELAIDQALRGAVPARIIYNGWDAGCHELRGDGLRTGDRIVIATERLQLGSLPRDPFSGHVIVWKQTADGWLFDEDALLYGSDRRYYPASARAATTTGDLLRLISDAPAPDTSTVSTPAEPGLAPAGPALALVFIAGLLLAMSRPARRLR